MDCFMDYVGLQVGLNWDYIWDHMGHQLGLVGLQLGLSESTSEIIPHTI